MSFIKAPKYTPVYQHKHSKTSIMTDRIIVDDAEGITESVDSGWRFTPISELETKIINIEGPYETSPMPNFPARPSVEEFDKPVAVSDSSIHLTNKTTYYFGIDKIMANYRFINETCGIIFKDIFIGPCKYIELFADVITNKNNSVEFYIIDRTKEAPILPIQWERVENEKLFFNMGPRFYVNTKEDVEIKKNGQTIKRSSDDLENLDLRDGIYTISYTPINAYSYSPENNTVGLKVIQRLYNQTAEPSCIKNLLIRKYGGENQWKK